MIVSRWPFQVRPKFFSLRPLSAADAIHRHTGKNARQTHGQIADHWPVTDADIDGAENEQCSGKNIGRRQRFVDLLRQKEIGIDSARDTFRRIRHRRPECGRWVGIVAHNDIPRK